MSKIKRFFNTLYAKLFKINDTPQKVSLGFGLGVFLGIFPGTGPIAALVISVILKVNRAACLLGCLITNTWISFVTFILAIQIGSLIFGVKWQSINSDWNAFIKEFHWQILFKLSVLKVFVPIVLGYIAIGLFFGFSAYLITLAVIKRTKNRKS